MSDRMPVYLGIYIYVYVYIYIYIFIYIYVYRYIYDIRSGARARYQCELCCSSPLLAPV